MKKSKIDREKIRFFILDIFHGGQQYKTMEERTKTPFPIKTVLLSAFTTVLVLTLIFSLIKISDLSAEIASLKRQTVSLSAKQDSLENELDHRYSFAEIIESAEAMGFAENGGRVIYIETADDKEEPEETEENEESAETPEETSAEE